MNVMRAMQPARWGGYFAIAMLVASWFSPFLPTVSAVGLFVQQSPVAITTSNSNSQAATLPAAATAGNLLVIVCSVGASSTVSVAGYSTAAASVSGTVSQGIFYKIATGGETTATCNSSLRTRNGIGAHMYEYSGMNTLSTLDTNATTSGTGTALSSGSATPTSSSSLVFTAFTTIGGTSFSGITAGYTKRADTLNTIHLGEAERFTTLTTAQSVAATNTVSAAWRGQIAIFKVAVGVKTADIVDNLGASVPSPSVSFPAAISDLGCNVNGATLGTSTQKIRVSNTTPSPTWSITIAATAGSTAYWDGGNPVTRYDFNDSTLDGCTDGGDADSLAGKLFINPSAATITPIGGGCTTTGLTLNSLTGFSEGTQDSITIITAGTGAQTGCTWDITDITLVQNIPAEQRTGTYSFSLTLTLLAM